MQSTELINYLNYAFLATIALSALMGFWKGAFRSIYFFAAYLILIIVGWLLSPVLAQAFFSYDISTLGTFEVEGIQITTMEAFITEYIEHEFPDYAAAFDSGTAVFEFGIASVMMVMRLVVFLIWLIIIVPLLTLIAGIVYLFVRPKKKKTLTSRFIGVGVTALHNLIILFILSIFLSGLISIINSGKNLSDITADAEDLPHQVIFTDAGPMLRLDNNDDEMAEFVFDFADQYRDSYIGKMSGLIKINQTALDEKMFDEIFSIKYKKNKIKIRHELATVLRIYSLLEENIEGELGPDGLIGLDEEIKAEIVDEISKLKLLHVAIPLGIEFVVNSGVLDEMLSDVEEYMDLQEIMPELYEINYQDEIRFLGSALIDALTLNLHNLDDDKNILLNLDPDTVDSLFTSIGSVEFIKVVGYQLLDAFANSDFANEYYDKIGFTEDVNIEGVDISEEISNLGNIYRAFSAVGITDTDYTKIDFSQITDTDINELGTAVYGSTLLSNNSRLLVQTLLPNEFRETLTVNQFDVDDFVSTVGLGLVLFSVGFFEDEEEVDFGDVLNDENIEKIANYISQSNLLSSNVNSVLSTLLDTVELPEGFELVVDEEFNWYGEDGRHEIDALLHGARILTEKDNYLVFTPEEIDILLSSRLICDSIVQIMENYAQPGGQLHGVLIVDDITDWHDVYDGNDNRTDGELRRFFNAAQLLLGDNPDIDNPDGLVDINRLLDLGDGTTDINGDDVIDEKDDEISVLVKSKIIVATAENELKKMTGEGGALHNVMYMPEDGTVAYYGPDGELRKFILAIRLLVTANTEPGQGITDIETISIASLADDENRDTVLTSEIIKTTIIVNIENEAGKEESVIVLAPELDRNSPEYNAAAWDDELPDFLNAIQIFVGTGDIASIEVDEAMFLSLTDNDIEEVVESRVISYTIIKKLEDEHNSENSLITIPDVYNPGTEEVTNEALWYDGELVRTLRALKELGISTYEDSFSLTPIFAEAKGDVPELILASEVIENTIIRRIESEAKPGKSLDGVLIIPNDVAWHKTFDGEIVIDQGELRRFLIAIDIILDGEELENATFHVENFFYDENEPERQDILLGSAIVEASIINKIETEAAVGGSLYGTLVFPSDWDSDKWYQTEGDSGELRRFLAGVDIIIGTDTFETMNFEADKFFGEDRDILLASHLLEASVVEYIIESTDPVSGSLGNILYLPDDLETNNEGWYQRGGGELDRFLDAVKIIIGESGTYTNADFTVDTILGPDRDEILESQVVETSAIVYIKESAKPKLTIPDDTNLTRYYYFIDEAIVWERTYQGEVLVDKGELRKFLDGIELILGGAGTFDDFAFVMDNFLAIDDFADILVSRTLEATLADMIDDLITGPLFLGYIKEPTNGYHWFHHITSTAAGLDGEVRRGDFALTPDTYQFSDLAGILNAIKKMDDANLNFNSIDAYTITTAARLGADDLAAALWDHSRIIRGSIATMLNEALDRLNIPPAYEPLKPEFDDSHFQEKQDVVNALNMFADFVESLSS